MLPRFCLKYRLKYIIAAIFCIFLLDFFGVFIHFFELNFYANFNYPIDGDVLKYAHQMRHNEKPDVSPINLYNYTFLTSNKQKCVNDDETLIIPRLLFIVKSAIPHFAQRNAIRNSWGFERRLSDVTIRTVFIIGLPTDATERGKSAETWQKLLDIEQENYQDIVQATFVDTYFNNTIKTMMGMKWAIKFCPYSKFYMFVDDDYYVSAKNVLRFVRNPVNYPEYLEDADETLRKLARRLSQSDLLNGTAQFDVKQIQHIVNNADNVRTRQNRKDVDEINEYLKKQELAKQKELGTWEFRSRNVLEMELANDVKLFSGFVFSSSPHRHKSSKWHVSLEEYPWHMWPTYVTAGAFILSREALIEMYYVSMFTKHFRFDDVYMGIVALKAGIEPLHSEEFYFHKATYYGSHSYRYVIASHGYTNPDEMVRVWSEARAAGHA